MKRRTIAILRALLLGAAAATVLGCARNAPDWIAGTPIEVSDDAGWCWFQGERGLVVDGKLLASTVAAGTHDRSRLGDVELSVVDLETLSVDRATLHDSLQLDDHNSAGLLPLDDERVLAVWSKHGPENRFYWSRGDPADAESWPKFNSFTPSDSSRITYSNLYRLSRENGRIYNFFRGLDNSWKPSFAFSDDGGVTWNAGNVVIHVPGEQKHRPYVRYASNGVDEIHLLYTQGHPRNYDNSVFHIVYRAGQLRSSDGVPIARMVEGLDTPVRGTLVYAGNAQRVAWVVDLRLDQSGDPVGLLSVQVDSAGLPVGEEGQDLRYVYARWDGGAWRTHEFAHAGTCLYQREADYTGLGVVNPADVNEVFISTNADPVTGEPLISAADGLRHWELFRGRTSDVGRTWSWQPMTRNSSADNLRPVVPQWESGRTALLWLRGTYRTYTDYDQRLMLMIDP